MKVTPLQVFNVLTYYMRSNSDLLRLLVDYCKNRESRKSEYQKLEIDAKLATSIIESNPQYFRSVCGHINKYIKTKDDSYFHESGPSDTIFLKKLAKLYLDLEKEYQDDIKKNVDDLIKKPVKTAINDLGENFTSETTLHNTTHLSLVYSWNDLDKFIGRNKELNELFIKIQKKNFVIINGIRGIGKTSLVQAFVTKHETFFSNIAWITVNENIKNSLLRTLSLSDKIKFSERHSNDTNIIEEQYKCLLNELSEFEGANLIIFDNANNAAEISETINDFSKCLPKWKVVFTTNSNIKTPKPLQLGELSTKDARSLFLSYYSDPDIDENEAEQALKFLETYGEEPINTLLSKIKNIPLIIEFLAKVDIADEFISLKDLTEIVNSINDLNNDQLKVAVQPGIKHPNACSLNPDEMTPFVYIKTIFAKDLKILDQDQKIYLYLFTILPSVEIPSDHLIYLLDTDKTHFISVMRKLKAWVNYNPQTTSFKMEELHQFAIRETFNNQDTILLDLKQIATRIKTKTEKLKCIKSLIVEYNQFLEYEAQVISGIKN